MKEMVLDEVKEVQLKILKEVSDFCDENNIKYFLAYGTLLGAIRHKGYIPWDDDIDIMMLRDDYDKFLELFNKSNEELKVAAYELDKTFPYTFAKVFDKKTTLKENVLINYNIGVNIDLFPMDYLPEDLNESEKLYKKLDILKKIYTLKVIKQNRNRKITKEIILYVSKIIFSFISIKKLVQRIINMTKRYRDKPSNYVGCAVWGNMGERVEKEAFSNSIDANFEGYIFKVPIGYDTYLKNVYGDYMELPPLEQRKAHHSYQAFWKDRG